MIELLQEWTNISILLGSLGVGYILKHYIPLDSKHIPLIMAVVGIVIGIGINGYVSFEVSLLQGMISGLASTGLHQVFAQQIEGKEVELPREVYKTEER